MIIIEFILTVRTLITIKVKKACQTIFVQSWTVSHKSTTFYIRRNFVNETKAPTSASNESNFVISLIVSLHEGMNEGKKKKKIKRECCIKWLTVCQTVDVVQVALETVNNHLKYINSFNVKHYDRSYRKEILKVESHL